MAVIYKKGPPDDNGEPYFDAEAEVAAIEALRARCDDGLQDAIDRCETGGRVAPGADPVAARRVTTVCRYWATTFVHRVGRSGACVASFRNRAIASRDRDENVVYAVPAARRPAPEVIDAAVNQRIVFDP